MKDFDSCPGCGVCRKVCPFLEEQGTPDRILRERPEAAFHCTSCRRCDDVCPSSLSPSAAFFEVKRRLVGQDAIPQSVRKTLAGVRTFAKTGHGFPFACYRFADTVFWPGCFLAGNHPWLVGPIRRALSRQLGTGVGLALDCCFDPVHGLGDSRTALAGLQQIAERLRKGGVRQVITGCLNCHKLLSAHLELKCLFVLEILPPEAFEMPGTEPVFLHHPCPASRWEPIRNRAGAAAGQASPGPNLPAGGGADSKSTPSPAACCGNGGGLSTLDPALAGRFLERILAEAHGRTIVTYCIGCRNRFRKAGAEAVHLLECLPGLKPRRTLPGQLVQWINRLSLALASRFVDAGGQRRIRGGTPPGKPSPCKESDIAIY